MSTTKKLFDIPREGYHGTDGFRRAYVEAFGVESAATDADLRELGRTRPKITCSDFLIAAREWAGDAPTH